MKALAIATACAALALPAHAVTYLTFDSDAGALTTMWPAASWIEGDWEIARYNGSTLLDVDVENDALQMHAGDTYAFYHRHNGNLSGAWLFQAFDADGGGSIWRRSKTGEAEIAALDAAPGFERFTFNERHTAGSLFRIRSTADASVDSILLSVVPEPAAWGVMVLGLLVAGAWVRRRAYEVPSQPPAV
jgi:hypothetical protein